MDKDGEEFIFSSKVNKGKSNNSSIESLYITLITAFEKTLDRIGKGVYEDSNKRRRKITLHSFRRWVKSTISDLGFSDYSEWFIGHSGSTYYRKSDKEKAELFKKIEPYLTYLDYSILERKGADIQTKVDTLEDENKELRNQMQTMKLKTDKIDDSLEKIEKLKKKLGI